MKKRTIALGGALALLASACGSRLSEEELQISAATAGSPGGAAPEGSAAGISSGEDGELVGTLPLPCGEGDAEPKADAESLLLQLGVILPLVGVGLIVFAYWNASGSVYVADQIPMLISGGILGLGLAIIGLGLFIRFSLARLLRFWLARLLLEQQAQTDRVVDALGRVEDAVRSH